MRRIWRSTSDWLRRERFTNMALMFPRSAASLAASRTASLWTWSNARATSPISSVESTSMGSTSSGASVPPPPLIQRTVSGSRTPATSSAPARSLCSGRVMERLTAMVKNSARASTSSTAMPSISAELIDLSRSEPLWLMIEDMNPCSTWCRLATRYAEPLAALVKAGFSAEEPPSRASAIACCTCACARSACAEDSAFS